MKSYPKIAISLVTAALFVGSATATAATSSHNQSSSPSISSLISTAIAKEVKNGKLTANEAGLVRLWLDRAITPDPRLRNAWQPIVRAAASYLGVTTTALELAIADGNSLAAIARNHGRSLPGLAQAVTAASKAPLDRAVSDGSLSAAARAKILHLMQAILVHVLRTGL